MRRPGLRITMRGSMLAIAVLAVYLAGYRALVRPDVFQESPSHPGQVTEFYPDAPRFCEVVFAPANWIDRALRPRYWARPGCVW